MTEHARGTFKVNLQPQEDAHAAAARLGRMSIDKSFNGDLQATSRGQMLAASTDVDGSAGYVALERVTGSLHGREGSFVLQHSGSMARGTPTLNVSVVPDSGTGQLLGLAGTLVITIAGGQHSYDFEYTLPESA